MDIPIYQVDAFAENVFEGNPAAVCPLNTWLPDNLLQSIAAENNLSETAYVVRAKEGYHIRWFTPVSEVDLCGHATLASAFVIDQVLGEKKDKIIFDSRSGLLPVTCHNGLYTLDFPSRPPVPIRTPDLINTLFGPRITETLSSDDYLVVLEDESMVQQAKPDMYLLRQLDLRGVILTAPSREFDFVVRFFAPKYGIDEDPVTGSAYTVLAPYWSGILEKNEMLARQISVRGGNVRCVLSGDRVNISGRAVLYLRGNISV